MEEGRGRRGGGGGGDGHGDEKCVDLLGGAGRALRLLRDAGGLHVRERRGHVPVGGRRRRIVDAATVLDRDDDDGDRGDERRRRRRQRRRMRRLRR